MQNSLIKNKIRPSTIARLYIQDSRTFSLSVFFRPSQEFFSVQFIVNLFLSSVCIVQCACDKSGNQNRLQYLHIAIANYTTYKTSVKCFISLKLVIRIPN